LAGQTPQQQASCCGLFVCGLGYSHDSTLEFPKRFDVNYQRSRGSATDGDPSCAVEMDKSSGLVVNFLKSILA
jgi:hypothetical protein